MNIFVFLLLLSFSLTFLASVSTSNEVLALLAFKRDIYDDPLSKLSDWNPQDVDPCSWTGVACSFPWGYVISIRLSNSSLKGFLTEQIFLLSSLQELALDNNFFVGSIPVQLGMLSTLNVLDLSFNNFSGLIPPELGKLTGVTNIYLNSNQLSGSIPSELGNLSNLLELRLDDNILDGVIPGYNDSNLFPSQNNSIGLCQLSLLNIANFSNNYLAGEIPTCFSSLPRSSFQKNCFGGNVSILQRSAQECHFGNQTQTVSDGEQAIHHKRLMRTAQPFWLLILEIVTAAIIFVFLITFMITTLQKCKSKPHAVLPWKKTPNWKDQTKQSIDVNLLKHVPVIDRQELEAACEDFSNIIGSSADSIIYKGTMKDGDEIAVLSLCIQQYHWTNSLYRSFKIEVANVSRLNHENIVKLLGYCQDEDCFSRMLVFEYASNGTLHEHIYCSDGCQLSWMRRMKIAVGIARGLRYMHIELQPPFTISELSCSSVYLTEDFSPKLVDFGRWGALFSKSGVHCYNIGESFYGTLDSSQARHFQVQENTYAFGVVMLELISGKPAYSKDGGCLAEWATYYSRHPKDIRDLVDPVLEKVNPEDLSVVFNVVSLCLEPEPSKRPSMQIIAAMLEDGIDSSVTAALNHSSLEWAELVISS